jgi:hypothetical protein
MCGYVWLSCTVALDCKRHETRCARVLGHHWLARQLKNATTQGRLLDGASPLETSRGSVSNGASASQVVNFPVSLCSQASAAGRLQQLPFSSTTCHLIADIVQHDVDPWQSIAAVLPAPERIPSEKKIDAENVSYRGCAVQPFSRATKIDVLAT